MKLKLKQKLKQYIQDLKSFATSEVNPTPEQRQDLIDEFIKEKAKSLCNDKLNNEPFSPTELYYIAENLKGQLAILIQEKSRKHEEYSRQLEEQSREEKHRAKVAAEVAQMLQFN